MKKGALELSVGTIIIIVLAMAMLILGMVLVRKIMCGAIGLTGEINRRVMGEIGKLFESTGGEVVCIGSGEKPAVMVPGEINTIYCSIRAPQTAKYTIKIKNLDGSIVRYNELKNWMIGSDIWSGNVAPGDELPKKVLRLKVPENAPNDLIMMQVEISKDNNLISTQQLDFEIRRVGLIKAAVC